MLRHVCLRYERLLEKLPSNNIQKVLTGKLYPFFLVIGKTHFTGDTDAHTQAWYPEGNTNSEGAKFDELFSTLNSNQIINESTHFSRDDCAPSCTDIVVRDQPNLVLSSGVRPLLDPTVKHQITFCKLNFKIPPPPKFQRKLWHFNRANVESIQKSMSRVSLGPSS